MKALRQSRRLALPWGQTAPRRTIFGSIAAIAGVISNPFETLKQLDESRQLLEKTRVDLKESFEKRQIPPLRTFSPLPGFFKRRREMEVLTRILSGVPTFLVMFGGTSVGKTALLREVLSQERYHVVYFDLRVAGSADLKSLFFALTVQFENLFTKVAEEKGYEDFNSQALSFKHARRDIVSMMEKTMGGPPGELVGIGDVARVMELFQSSMLAYWNFDPAAAGSAEEETKESEQKNKSSTSTAKRDNTNPNPKRIPVVLFDECHELPALIPAPEAMKMILDVMLVLTKQDRLCHVIHATSDPFYMHYLRSNNVGHHCKILTIGDCSMEEARRYWDQCIIELIDSRKEVTQLRMKLPSFEDANEVFGGKLTHIQGFIKEFVDSDGKLRLVDCSHFIQAYILLHLHLSYSYFATHFSLPMNSSKQSSSAKKQTSEFSREQLLSIMRYFTENVSAPYFQLCKDMGTPIIDALIRARILELRWTPPVTQDIPPMKPEDAKDLHRPLLIPMTGVLRYAMKIVKEEETQKSLASA